MIAIEELKRLLWYNPETGNIYWRVSRSNQIREGAAAGTVHRSGRICIEINGIEYKAAVIAWALYYGEWPTSIVDHEDRDNANDRILNLRLASKQQNCANTKIYSNNKSGYRGVSYAPGGKWKAYIRIGKKPKHLGVFDTPQEASAAYEKAAKEIYGAFVGQLSR